MSFKRKVDDVWREGVAPYIKVDGSWKIAQSAWTKLDGAWRNWFLQGGLNEATAITQDESLIAGNFNLNLGSGSASSLNTITRQTDGKLLVGGNSTSFNSTTVGRLFRLNTDGTLDTDFLTNVGSGVNSTVNSIAVQSDGKILVGGAFTLFNGTTANRLVSLNSNGTLNSAFMTNLGTSFSGTVNSIAVQSDGKILVGGAFTLFNGGAAGRLVRLNSDGTLDSTFLANMGAGADNAVISIAVQSDGKILVGGSFTAFSGTTIGRLVRLNSNGTLDSAFITNLGTGASSTITSIVVQSDNKILIGGNNAITFNGTTVNSILRLNSDGTIDSAFNTNTGSGVGSAAVLSIKVQSDGKIVLCGDFLTFNGTTANRLVRLNSTGTIDSTFLTNTGIGANALLSSFEIQADGKLVLVGSSTTFNGVDAGYIIRINSDGTSEPTPGFSSTIYDIKVQPDGKILVVGNFNIVNSVISNGIIRLNLNGEIDSSFNSNTGSGANGIVYSVEYQSDGKILVGGAFTTFNGTTANRLLRLNSNGTIDTAFLTNLGTGFGNSIRAIKVQPDGKILVAGEFATSNGVTINRITRLNSDGTDDSAFRVNLGGASEGSIVRAIELLPDGKILLGGTFSRFNQKPREKLVILNSDGTEFDPTNFYTTFSGAGSTTRAIARQSDGKLIIGGEFTNFNGVSASRLIRLNTDGTIDTGFLTNIGTGSLSTIHVIQIQSDGKILVGGAFTTFNGISANRLVRLNSDGSVDTAFATNFGTGANSTIYDLAITSTGSIIAVGAFTSMNGTAVGRVNRISSSGVPDDDTGFPEAAAGGANASIFAVKIQSDGKLLLAGSFSAWGGTSVTGIVRVATSGARDTTWPTSTNFNIASGFGPQCLALQSDGKILVGGVFTSYRGTTANRIARLNTDGTLDSTFTASFNTVSGQGVDSIAVQSDGKIIVNSRATIYNGTTINGIARINSDGSLDTAFAANTGTGIVRSSSDTSYLTNTIPIRNVLILPDDKILLLGDLSYFNGNRTNNLVALTSSGSLDTSSPFYVKIKLFDSTSALMSLYSIKRQSDGKILMVGDFTSFNDTAIRGLIRFNSDFTLDSAFNTNLGTGIQGLVYDVEVQPSGKIVAVGSFDTVNTTINTNNLVRYEADGTLDSAFLANTGTGFLNTETVFAAAIQNDSKILLGGTFEEFNGEPRYRFARIGGDLATTP